MEAEVMENFFKIRAEKQEHIIKAALLVFGRQGYRKASMSDIAREAGITKGLITYYFGSKKNLYLYLLEFAQTSYEKAVKERLMLDVTDFFERLKILTDVQVTALRKYPATITFFNSVFYETDPEVLQNIKQFSAAGYASYNELLFEGAEFSKLKPGFDSRLISKFFVWAHNGFIAEIYTTSSADKVEEITAEFYQSLEMVSRTFQKRK